MVFGNMERPMARNNARMSLLLVLILLILSNASASKTDSRHFQEARSLMVQSYTELLEQIIKPCLAVSNNIMDLPVETTQGVQFKDLQDRIEDCHRKTQGIIPLLKRDKMKAVVFGSTSSGKSTLINALLGDDVLPTSMGVCSSCLVQIVGCDEEESYLTLPDGSQSDVEDLEELGNEVEENHLGAGDTAIVHWPKTKCDLLDNDILIIDRPGISSSPEVDQIVNNQCADADIHIFVIDSIATITTESREYFVSVAKKLSKPNIFFVYNKWDESDNQTPERNVKVQKQHIKAAKDLVREAGNVNEFDKSKIFFVSAREILWARTKDARLLGGHEKRQKEFRRFKQALQTSISKHAIKTRFGPSCNEGIGLCNALEDVIKTMQSSIDHAVEDFSETHSSLSKEVVQLTQKQTKFKEEFEELMNKANRNLKQQVKEAKSNIKSNLNSLLRKITFEEDQEDAYLQSVQKVLHDKEDDIVTKIQHAVSNDFSNIIRNMKDLADDTETPTSKFRLRSPQTSLSDHAVEDNYKESASFVTQASAVLRRGMSSSAGAITTLGAGVGAGAAFLTGIAGVPVLGIALSSFGASALGLHQYLENQNQKRKDEILKPIMERFHVWLDDQGEIAQTACLTQVENLGNMIQSRFNGKINKKVKDNKERFMRIDKCLKKLQEASNKINKKLQLQGVMKHFEEFQRTYLQEISPG